MESCSVSALDRPAAELTVVDVYDIASLLGQEFERVIDRYGCEAMVGVVPKVVRVLELLEALVNYGGARHQAEELQRELDRLRQERSDRYEQDRKHQMVSAVYFHFTASGSSFNTSGTSCSAYWPVGKHTSHLQHRQLAFAP